MAKIVHSVDISPAFPLLTYYYSVGVDNIIYSKNVAMKHNNGDNDKRN